MLRGSSVRRLAGVLIAVALIVGLTPAQGFATHGDRYSLSDRYASIDADTVICAYLDG